MFHKNKNYSIFQMSYEKTIFKMKVRLFGHLSEKTCLSAHYMPTTTLNGRGYTKKGTWILIKGIVYARWYISLLGLPTTKWVTSQQFSFFTVLVAGSLKCQQGWFSLSQLGLQLTFLLLSSHMVLPLYMLTPSVSLCESKFSLPVGLD